MRIDSTYTPFVLLAAAAIAIPIYGAYHPITKDEVLSTLHEHELRIDKAHPGGCMVIDQTQYLKIFCADDHAKVIMLLFRQYEPIKSGDEVILMKAPTEEPSA